MLSTISVCLLTALIGTLALIILIGIAKGIVIVSLLIIAFFRALGDRGW